MKLYPRSQSKDWFHALKTKTSSDEHRCLSYILESSNCKLSHTCWPWNIEKHKLLANKSTSEQSMQCAIFHF
jgi:hypothetical protein